MKKATTLIIIFFLFNIYCASASYYFLGGDNRDFKAEISYFNKEANITGIPVSPGGTPSYFLSGDFDNDSMEEIAVCVDGDYLKVYSTPSLTLEHSVTLSSRESAGRVFQCGDMQAGDYNDDGVDDIFVLLYDNNPSSDSVIHWISWNTTHLINQTELKSGVMTGDIVRFNIGCDDAEDNCILIQSSQGGGSGNFYMGVQPFNISDFITKDFDGGGVSGRVLLSSPGEAQAYCLPAVSIISSDDLDGDGDYEFVFSVMHTSDIAGEKPTVIALQVAQDENLTLTIEATDSITTSLSLAADNDCSEGDIISNVLIQNIDNTPTLKEVIIGFAYDEADSGEWDIRLASFDSNLNHMDNFVANGLLETLTEAKTLGSPFKSNVITGQNIDFCVPAYSNKDEKFYALCASQTKTYYLSHAYLDYEIDTGYNTTNGYQRLAHSTQANHSTAPYEILTQYGMLQFGSDETLTQIWDISAHSLPETYIFERNEQGFSDVLIWDSPSLYLYTSEPIKYGCEEQLSCYSTITINPCTEQSWCWNASAEIRVTVFDVDGDDLQARVFFYANHSNLFDSGWSGNVSSGSTLTFVQDENGNAFKANLTGDNFRILVYIRDNDKPGQMQIIEKYFSVVDGAGCIGLGECLETISSQTGSLEDEETPFEDLQADYNDNAVAAATKEIADTAGITVEMTVLIIALLVMIAMVYYAISTGHNLSQASGYSLASGAAIILFGAIFRFLSVAWIIVPLIVAVGAFFLVKFLAPSGGEA